MTGLKSRVIYRRPDGKWIHRRTDRLSATSIHETKQDAESVARAMLEAFGGGNLTVVEQVNSNLTSHTGRADVDTPALV